MEGRDKGWISLHRDIQEHWIWQDAEKLRSWLDLLLLANHQDKKLLLGNELIELKRGEFHTSEMKLIERWGWSKKKVRSFLELLEKDNMIALKKTKKGTTITIENYKLYQGQGNHEGTAKEQQKSYKGYINNNDKNDNNNNKEVYMSDSNEYRLATYLFKHIKKNNPNAKEPNFQTWSKQFSYILDVDKRSIEEVKEIIEFSQADSFWFKNILSPDKLRKQYDRLLLEIRNQDKNRKSGSKGNFNNYKQRTYDFDSLEKKLLGWEN